MSIFVKLAEQAVDVIGEPDMGVEEGMSLFINQFGKEVVNECISVILQNNPTEKQWATQVSKAIKRHFEMSKNG